MKKTINYNHLYYFLAVAKEGSIAEASKKLNITPQTISGQISVFEDNISSKLFQKVGRNLQITDTGQLVLSYAEEIFELGQELSDVLRGNPAIGPASFIVGAASALPKTIVYKIIEPVLSSDLDIHLTSREGPMEDMLADLAIHKIDLVLSDTPINKNINVRAYNHLLGESSLSCFASPKLHRQCSKHFPESLKDIPLLLPTKQYAARKIIDKWLFDQGIDPLISGQFDDSALLKSFGQAGVGAFFMPTAIEEEVCQSFNVKVVAQLEQMKQKYYAISAERKVKHPAVAIICDSAREQLFD